MPEKTQEKTDALFRALLEKTAQKMKEEAIPAGQPGGPAILPDQSDLTQTGPLAGAYPAPQGPSAPGRPGPGGGRPVPTPDAGLGGFHTGAMPGPYVVPVVPVGDRPSRSKVGKRPRLTDPDKCSTFDEQVRVIADNIRSYVLSGRSDRAASFVAEWCDGIVDDDGSVFPEVHETLDGLSKSSLVTFAESLIRFIEKNTD